MRACRSCGWHVSWGNVAMVLGGEDGRSNLRCGAKGGRQTLIKVVQRPATWFEAHAQLNFSHIFRVTNGICACNMDAEAMGKIKAGTHRRSVEVSATLSNASASIATGVVAHTPNPARFERGPGVRDRENLPPPSRAAPVGILIFCRGRV